MNKLLISASMAALFGAVVPAAQAATVAGNFNVTVTLTSVCTMAAITDLAFGTYVAFGAAVIATPTNAVLTCTRGLTGVNANFDTTPAIGSTGAAAAINAVGAGVISGLNYTMAATRALTAAGTAADAATIGTAATWTYAISGNMPAGQAGTCTGPSCAGTQLRTLTVTY